MNDRWETIRDVVWPLVRDVILFFAGLGLLIAEAHRSGTERLGFLGLYAAMMGLPLFLRADERGKRK
jgi:hypothetical protein